MVKYLEKGEKSRIFYTFSQLYMEVVKVNIFFFKLNTMVFENILQLRNGLKMFY